MDLNIYSEPLFPASQGIPSSSSSSSATQTQRRASQLQLGGGDETVIDSRATDDIHAHALALSGSKRVYDADALTDCQEEDILIYDNEEEDAEVEEEEVFCLDSLVVRASDLKQEFFTTGCVHFDACLKGGLPTFGITEFFGEAGTGKTQICLQLAITAQLPKERGGLDSSVYYICTERSFPSMRLAEMASYIEGKFAEGALSKATDNVFVEHATDIDSLATCVEVKLPILVRQNPERKFRLIILDSVAGVFRYEYDDLTKRTFELRQLAQNLHEFSVENQAAIVVSNQVTASIDLARNTASLGMAWQNMVTSRIGLSKVKDSNLRLFTVSFSPHVPCIEIPFTIASDGVKCAK